MHQEQHKMQLIMQFKLIKKQHEEETKNKPQWDYCNYKIQRDGIKVEKKEDGHTESQENRENRGNRGNPGNLASRGNK
jgi:hypothetical protein